MYYRRVFEKFTHLGSVISFCLNMLSHLEATKCLPLPRPEELHVREVNVTQKIFLMILISPSHVSVQRFSNPISLT